MIDIDKLWMPFTAQAGFARNPRMLVRAEGMFYATPEGRKVLDAVSGLWCVVLGHGRKRLADAAHRQLMSLDYASMFQVGHPAGFEYASKLLAFAPPGFGRVFLSNSGSEAIDTALKIALQFQKLSGNAGRTRIIGRERGYHGVGFGGMSVGGIAANRRDFGPLLPGVDHLRHTHIPGRNAFSIGQPPHGAELADDLERLVALHDASTIAAVVVEPVAGSAGVLVPPAGYLERLRDITRRHGILLIFDEVITGFGRLGANFAAQRFGVSPDLIVSAKGISNGCIPMGATLVHERLLPAFDLDDADRINFYHGYTGSANPVACAVASEVLDIFAEEELVHEAAGLEALLAESVHGLRERPHVVDIRNCGVMAAVELAPSPEGTGKRGLWVLQQCFERGVLVRATGDTIALAPALIAQPGHIEQAVKVLGEVLSSLD